MAFVLHKTTPQTLAALSFSLVSMFTNAFERTIGINAISMNITVVYSRRALVHIWKEECNETLNRRTNFSTFISHSTRTNLYLVDHSIEKTLQRLLWRAPKKSFPGRLAFKNVLLRLLYKSVMYLKQACDNLIWKSSCLLRRNFMLSIW